MQKLVGILYPYRNRQPIDPRTYDDPHEHANIATLARNYPYYDQYGRPSNQRIDAERAAFDGYGRRIPFQTYEPAPSRGDSDYDDWLRRQHALRRGDQQQPSAEGSPVAGAQYQPAVAGAQNEPAPSRSDPGYNDWLQRQYALRAGEQQQQPAQYEPAPSRSDPGYEDWLRRQYALRGQQPRGQPSQPQFVNNYGDSGSSASSSGAQNQPEVQEWPASYPGYGPAAPGAQNQQGSSSSWDSDAPQNGAQADYRSPADSQGSGPQYYWPSGERKPYPAASQGSQGYPSQESSQAARVPDAQNLQDASEVVHRPPSEEEIRYRNMDISGQKIHTDGVVRLARIKPQIIVRDRTGRTYRPWTDPSTGRVTYIAESPTGDDKNVNLPASVHADIERQLEEERRRQLENRLREQIGQGDETQRSRGGCKKTRPDSHQEDAPITAAEQARRPTFNRRRHASRQTSNFF